MSHEGQAAAHWMNVVLRQHHRARKPSEWKHWRNAEQAASRHGTLWVALPAGIEFQNQAGSNLLEAFRPHTIAWDIVSVTTTVMSHTSTEPKALLPSHLNWSSFQADSSATLSRRQSVSVSPPPAPVLAFSPPPCELEMMPSFELPEPAFSLSGQPRLRPAISPFQAEDLPDLALSDSALSASGKPRFHPYSPPCIPSY